MESIGAPKARRSPWNANPMAFHAMRRLFALPLPMPIAGAWVR
jgi:hypothetical protein